MLLVTLALWIPFGNTKWGKKKPKKLVRQRYWNSKRAKQMWKIRGSSDTVLIKTLLRLFLSQ